MKGAQSMEDNRASVVSGAMSGKDDGISIKEASTRGDSIATARTDHQQRVPDHMVQCSQRDALIKAAYHKIDMRLLVFYYIIFLFVKLSARNITNAAIINIEQGTGIRHQLGDLSSEQWAWVLSIFYYPYIVFEPLSTIAIKWCRPDRWMGRILITWGIIAMCQAAVQSYAGLLACRSLLGLAEAGLWPAILYHLSFWYPTDHLPLRIAILSACGQCSGTLSGLLAFGIAYLNGMAGLSGWRWLFVLEGIPALIMGIFGFFCLPDYPERASFLSEDERQAVLSNIPETQPTSGAKTWDSEQVKAMLKDPVFYSFLTLWTCEAVGGWGVTIAFPSVVFGLGLKDSTITQLLTMPPYAIGCLVLLGIAKLIHKKKVRAFPCALALELACCICYVCLLVVHHAMVKYLLVCLTIICCVGILPILWPERILAAQGTTSTGLAIGITGSVAHLTGIIGPRLYQHRFGPTYRISFASSVGILVVCIIATAVTWILLMRRDARNLSRRSAVYGQTERKASQQMSEGSQN